MRCLGSGDYGLSSMRTMNPSKKTSFPIKTFKKTKDGPPQLALFVI
jgi:hypothetical protein